MEALLDTFLSSLNQNNDLTITIKGKPDRGRTHLTVFGSKGVLNKPRNDIKITAEIDKRRVPRSNRIPSLPTLNEHAPVGSDESINGLLV